MWVFIWFLFKVFLVGIGYMEVYFYVFGSYGVLGGGILLESVFFVLWWFVMGFFFYNLMWILVIFLFFCWLELFMEEILCWLLELRDRLWIYICIYIFVSIYLFFIVIYDIVFYFFFFCIFLFCRGVFFLNRDFVDYYLV